MTSRLDGDGTWQSYAERTSRLGRVLAHAAVQVTVLLLLADVLAAQASPSVVWSEREVAVTVGDGRPAPSITVSFVSSELLSNVSVEVVPGLRDFVRAEPERLACSTSEQDLCHHTYLLSSAIRPGNDVHRNAPVAYRTADCFTTVAYAGSGVLWGCNNRQQCASALERERSACSRGFGRREGTHFCEEHAGTQRTRHWRCACYRSEPIHAGRIPGSCVGDTERTSVCHKNRDGFPGGCLYEPGPCVFVQPKAGPC